VPQYLWRKRTVIETEASDLPLEDAISLDSLGVDHPIAFKEVERMSDSEVFRVKASLDAITKGSDGLAQLAQLFRDGYSDFFIAEKPEPVVIEMLTAVANHALSRTERSIEEIHNLHFYALGLNNAKASRRSISYTETRSVEQIRRVLVRRGEQRRNLPDEILEAVYPIVKSNAALTAAKEFLDLSPDNAFRNIFGSSSAANRMVRMLATDLLDEMREVCGRPINWDWPSSMKLAPLIQADESWSQRDWAALRAFGIICHIACPVAINNYLLAHPDPADEAERFVREQWRRPI
jgi:hypothetical protein